MAVQPTLSIREKGRKKTFEPTLTLYVGSDRTSCWASIVTPLQNQPEALSHSTKTKCLRVVKMAPCPPWVSQLPGQCSFSMKNRYWQVASFVVSFGYAGALSSLQEEKRKGINLSKSRISHQPRSGTR